MNAQLGLAPTFAETATVQICILHNKNTTSPADDFVAAAEQVSQSLPPSRCLLALKLCKFLALFIILYINK